MACSVPSAKDLAAAQVAVDICNNSQLKKEILYAIESDYDDEILKYSRERNWYEKIEEKATVILRNRGIPENLKGKIMGNVLCVGMRMLIWAEYHEINIGFTRDHSFNFLNSSFFTTQGIIDNKKAANVLIKDESLDIEQKYKLACLYCFTDHIPSLYRKLTKEDKKKFFDARNPYRIKQPQLVKFWSYYLMGEINTLRGEESLDHYRLETAVQSGNKAAVEYCLEKTKLRWKKEVVLDAALLAVRKKTTARDAWIVFRETKYTASDVSWVPSDYYMDILCFLFSKMRDKRVEFLIEDVKGDEYGSELGEDKKRSRVLAFFLNWPYQNYFMETVKLMWDFLPQRSYAVLLLKICDKIEAKQKKYRYGEEKSYEYRKLLMDSWLHSPERYKRYVFNNEVVSYRCGDGSVIEIEAGVGLLTKLLTLKIFTCADEENIRLILASATDEEKQVIASSEEWEKMCIELIREQKWEILYFIILNCFKSKEETDKFKKSIMYREEIQLIFIRFAKEDKWNAAESIIKWSSLPEEEVNQLKSKIIGSPMGRKACVDLISSDKGIKAVDKFIKWSLPSEEVKAFKKRLVSSYEGIGKCKELVREDQLEIVTDFISLCLSSEEEIREFKETAAYSWGCSVCRHLISHYFIESTYDEEGDLNGTTVKFHGGQWERVEKFLTWCFSSEEEINDFKKDWLFEMSGVEIHFNLVKSSQWEEAETFFAWLGLSPQEIKALKKETLFHYRGAGTMLWSLVDSENDQVEYPDYGRKEEAVELLLKWYLTDKETVLEYKDKFEREYEDELEEDALSFFDLMIQQRLKDIDEEKLVLKRKSETFPPNKRLCDLNIESRIEG